MYVFIEDIKTVWPCPLILDNTILIKEVTVFCCIISYHDYGYLKGLAMKDRYLLKAPSNPATNHTD